MFTMKSIPDEPMTEAEISRQLEFVSMAGSEAVEYTELMEVEDSCKKQS